jgi:pimeloyl-ACP methyl ester carboxylesterase
LLVGGLGLTPASGVAQTPAEGERVVIESAGWQLVGDLVLPGSAGPLPAVLLLNQAAGNRTAYVGLAQHLADRGMASLRLDLRGHGESTNLGRFVPGDSLTASFIWDSEADVIAARRYLASLEAIDEERIAIVGASLTTFARAYVALSPGSFSDESIVGIDTSGIPWLFIASREERFLMEITAAVVAQTRTADIMLVPGRAHASDLLEDRPDLVPRIVAWLHQALGSE